MSSKSVFQILIFSTFLFTSAKAFSQSRLVEPKFENQKLVLGEDIKKAMREENSKFKILKPKNFSKSSLKLTDGQPMAVIADYNSDGIKDIALYGVDHSKRKAMVYLLVSSKSEEKYKAFEVMSEDLNKNIVSENNTYLSGNQLLKYKRDVLMVEFFDDSFAGHSAYYFSNSQNQVIAYDKYDKFLE